MLGPISMLTPTYSQIGMCMTRCILYLTTRGSPIFGGGENEKGISGPDGSGAYVGAVGSSAQYSSVAAAPIQKPKRAKVAKGAYERSPSRPRHAAVLLGVRQSRVPGGRRQSDPGGTSRSRFPKVRR